MEYFRLTALGFKHVGHSFIHFTTLWLKISGEVKEVMCEKSSALCPAQTKHKLKKKKKSTMLSIKFYLSLTFFITHNLV